MKFHTLILFSIAAMSSVAYGENNPSSEQAGWRGDVELGYSLKEGNTKSKSLKTKIDTHYNRPLWQYDVIVQANSESSNKVTTEEEYRFSTQANRDLSETGYLLARSAYDKRRFSGFDYELSASMGYGYRVFTTDTRTLDLELAPGYRKQALENGHNEEGVILRAALAYQRQISDSATFTQSFSIEAGEDSAESISETALKTAINSSLSLKLAYLVEYHDAVPAETKHADQETLISLVYAF